MDLFPINRLLLLMNFNYGGRLKKDITIALFLGQYVR